MGNNPSRPYGGQTYPPTNEHLAQRGWSLRRKSPKENRNAYYLDEESYQYPLRTPKPRTRPNVHRKEVPVEPFHYTTGAHPQHQQYQPITTPVQPMAFPSAMTPQVSRPVIPNMSPPLRRSHTHTHSAPAMAMPVPSFGGAPVVPPNSTPYSTAGVPMPTPVTFPQPQIPQTQNPVIPSMPQPEIHRDRPMEPGSPLGPGEYGPRDRHGYRGQSPRRHHSQHHTAFHHDSSDSDDYDHDQQHGYRNPYRERDYERPIHHNPLPPPPKDVFEDSPYISLLRDLRLPPEESTLRSRPSVPRTIVIPATAAIPMTQPHYAQNLQGTRGIREKKHRKGLFRSLSNRLGSIGRHSEDHSSYGHGQPSVVLAQPIIYGLPANQQSATSNMVNLVYDTPAGRSTPAPSTMQMPTPAPAAAPSSPTPSGRPQPRAPTPTPPPPPPRSPPIKIDPNNELSGFIHFSPHPVHFARKVYPTAYHLFQALKFMEHNPNVAERIRGTMDFDEIERIVDENRNAVRPDWEAVICDMMDEVLFHKFIQHPSLRELLLSTAGSTLLYSSGQDNFWGDGPFGQGANELGKSLMRVRDRLIEEGFTA